MIKLGTCQDLGLSRDARAVAALWFELVGALDLLQNHDGPQFIGEEAEEQATRLENFLKQAKENAL